MCVCGQDNDRTIAVMFFHNEWSTPWRSTFPDHLPHQSHDLPQHTESDTHLWIIRSFYFSAKKMYQHQNLCSLHCIKSFLPSLLTLRLKLIKKGIQWRSCLENTFCMCPWSHGESIFPSRLPTWSTNIKCCLACSLENVAVLAYEDVV